MIYMNWFQHKYEALWKFCGLTIGNEIYVSTTKEFSKETLLHILE